VLDRPIGSGAFGEVWEAHRYSSLVPVPVAIKLLSAAALSRAQFLQEAQLRLPATGSPDVNPILDVGEDRDIFYFVSRLCREGALRSRIGANTGQGVPRAASGP